MKRFSVFSFRNKLPEEVEIIVVTVGVVSSFEYRFTSYAKANYKSNHRAYLNLNTRKRRVSPFAIRLYIVCSSNQLERYVTFCL